MGGGKSKRGVKAVIVYLVLTGIAGLLPFLPGHGPLWGVFAIILTLPWSLLAVFLLDAMDPKLLDSPMVGLGAVAICVLLNATIIYFIMSRSQAVGGKQGTGSSS